MPLETSPPPEAAILADINHRLAAELNTAKQQLNQIAEAGRASAKSDALTQALAGVALQPGAREQLDQLIGKDLQVHTQDGRFHVTGPQLVPLQEHVRATLGKPEFAHFLKGGSTPAPGPRINADGRPAGVGDWIMAQGAAHRASQQGDPRTSMNLPFGLGRPVPR